LSEVYLAELNKFDSNLLARNYFTFADARVLSVQL